MSSLGMMIYILARAVPRISDEITDSGTSKFDKFISSLPLEKIDIAFGNFLEKTLRKARLILLKMDNAVGGYLNSIKKFNGNGFKNGNGEEKPNLFNSNGNTNRGGNNYKDDKEVAQNSASEKF